MASFRTVLKGPTRGFTCLTTPEKNKIRSNRKTVLATLVNQHYIVITGDVGEIM